MHTLIRHALAVVLAAAAASTAVHANAQTAAPAEMLDVAGHPVQISNAGSGRYTVIFESGFGTDLRSWRKVAPEIAEVARVVSYSRAGYGASAARTEPRTLLQSSVELDQLIAAAKLRPPFILVGHSYGGMLVRAFAARHPQDVAGMVLIDPSDERFAPALRKLDPARVDADDARFDSIVPPKFKPELALLKPVLDSGVFPIAGALPDVPVVVMTSMQPVEKPEFFLETAAAREVLRGLHADFARRFRDGSQVVTVNSGHSIQLEEPALVVQAIKRVIAAADLRLSK
jgi:pimeloyl-ACP methyl ester carboxylesterase